MTEVKLNKNSWHFKYYSYVVSSEMPKSLCPYFWTMILILILSPILLIEPLIKYLSKILPKKEKKELTIEQLVDKFHKDAEREKKRTLFWNKMGRFFSKYILLPISIIFICYMIYLGCNSLGVFGFIQMILIISISGGVMAVLILMIEKTVKYTSRFKKYLPNLSKPLSKLLNIFTKPFKIIFSFIYKVFKICGQMINAQYTKMCPMIIWEEESVNNGNKE
jgi:hypothetical protein